MKPAKKAPKQSRTPTAVATRSSTGFTAEERRAMREHVQEMKTDADRGRRSDQEHGERAVLEKIATLPQPDRAMAEWLHAIIKTCAPSLAAKTWYGMPAYATGGNVLCFFQSAQKFKTRYATIGFSDKANLDDGDLWPTAFALKELSAATEAKICALVKKAVG